MIYRSISFVSLMTLAACGGSSSTGPTVVPVSASGFATAESLVGRGDVFEVDQALRTLEIEDGVYVIDRQDIGFEIADDGSEVRVTIAGETYVTVPRGSDYAYEDDNDFIFIQRIDTRVDEAEIVEVFALLDDNLNSSLIVIGDDTNPTEVAALNGGASFEGSIYVDGRNELGDGFASGAIELDVNFDSNTVAGGFNLEDSGSSSAEFIIPTSAYDLDRTEITANGFEGTISLTEGDIEGSISNATYSGRFFGQNAPTAAGQIGAVVTAEDQSTTVITGAFIATR